MRDKTKTRARIEAEALRLFAAKGIDATSVRDIAQAAGLAEGALYRHFPSKEELARSIFLTGYSALATEIAAAGREARPFRETVDKVVGIFCALFDRDRALFAFLLLSQHAFLGNVPAGEQTNVVDAVAGLFQAAIRRGDVAGGDADLMAAVALGIVAQPATFTLYGRLTGPMAARQGHLCRAVVAAAGAK